jgi:hypothetical protein
MLVWRVSRNVSSQISDYLLTTEWGVLGLRVRTRHPQVYGVTAHTPNKQKRTAERRSSYSSEVGWGANNPSRGKKEIHVYQCMDTALALYGFFGCGRVCPQKADNFLHSWATNSFSRILLHRYHHILLTLYFNLQQSYSGVPLFQLTNAGLLMDVQPGKTETYLPTSSYIISNDVEENRMKAWYFYQQS